jgi:transglutaminase-like putative cysteine protease
MSIYERLLRPQGIILLLSLSALICLPIATSDLVRDAGMSLLLPITVIGLLLAWSLAYWRVRNLSSAFILLFLGPLTLYIRVAQMSNVLFELISQLFRLPFTVFYWIAYKVPPDFFSLFLSADHFNQRVSVFGVRVFSWTVALFRGVEIEDPVARTFAWSVFLWLIAVWAGWLIYRNRRFLAGMLPSTVMLAVVLEYTGRDKGILWFHLALLLFLYGFVNYQRLQDKWDSSNTDYAESTRFDTLMAIGMVSLGLVISSYFVSTFSIKEFIDRFREKQRTASGESQAAQSAYQTPKDTYRVMGFSGGMPRSYVLSAGPELSTKLAMTVSTGDLPPMPANATQSIVVPRYYWRALTYSIYTGVGWSNPPVLTEDIPISQELLKSLDSRYRIVFEDVTFTGDEGERLFWTGNLLRANVPLETAWVHKAKDLSLPETDMMAAVATVKSYKAESAILNITTKDLRASPAVYPDWVKERFLALPDSVPERVLALARDLTATAPTPYDRALAIQDYLRQIPYTLEISDPPTDRDVVDYFLFDLKKGYCDYYATSMVVLARAAGLPARLVAGYASGSYDVERAEYRVTEDYAHSWVEIYFANIGWVEFEPTAAQPAIVYQERIEPTPTPVPQYQPEGFAFARQFISFFKRASRNSWFPAIVLLLCGLLWIGFDSMRLRQIDPSQAIQILYQRFRRFARPVTGFASKNQTAHSYALVLNQSLSALESSPFWKWIKSSHSEIDQLTELFSHSLFAPLPSTRADANHAIKTWSHLRWRLLLANILRIKNK